jgi:hypothetical protein
MDSKPQLRGLRENGIPAVRYGYRLTAPYKLGHYLLAHPLTIH